MSQWANAIERFDVLKFRWFLANAHLQSEGRGQCILLSNILSVSRRFVKGGNFEGMSNITRKLQRS